MGWFVAFCFGAILALVLWRHQVFRRHWRQLEAIIADLTEGREPKSFVFLKSTRFTTLAAELERLAEAQERLRRRRTQEEKNLQAILGSMEEAVMVIDRRRSIRLVNPSFIHLFQVRFDPINQTSLQTIGSPALEELIATTFSAAEPQAGDVTLDAQPSRHISVNAVPMRDAAGGDAVVIIFRDVTRLRQLEEVRREFVANVSHELRTPLSIFHGYLENVMDDPALVQGPHGEALTVMRKHSLRLNALLEDLLILARLESRADLFHFEEVSLDAFLQSILSSWRLRTEEKGISLKTEVAAEIQPVQVDPLRLEQVVNNLIDNALNHSDPGSAITVRAAEVDSSVEIRVEDSGIGIQPSDLPHIFERFYRADKARSRQRGGTGLGLSIVKHIVQSHGGTVAAESAPGSGTTIILRFPRKQPPGEASPANTV